MMTARVDPEICTGCETCIDVCPSQAMHIECMIAKVAADTCVDCGACIDSCPVKAIDLDLDDGLTLYTKQQKTALAQDTKGDVVVDTEALRAEPDNFEERIEDVQDNDETEVDVKRD